MLQLHQWICSSWYQLTRWCYVIILLIGSVWRLLDVLARWVRLDVNKSTESLELGMLTTLDWIKSQNFLSRSWIKILKVKCRVTTCLENLEMSGNLTAVKEMSGILLKIGKCQGKNLVREKWPKTVYCKLHICVHTLAYRYLVGVYSVLNVPLPVVCYLLVSNLPQLDSSLGVDTVGLWTGDVDRNYTSFNGSIFGITPGHASNHRILIKFCKPIINYEKITEINIPNWMCTNSHGLIKPQLATVRLRLHASMMSICLSIRTSVRPSVCLSPKCKNVIFSKSKQFRGIVYWRPIGSRTQTFQITHYWTPKIQDGGEFIS